MFSLVGLAAGLVAAFLQSCSYVVSAGFVRESGRPAWRLLAPSFFLMGLAAAAALPFAWPPSGAPAPDWGRLLPAAFGCILFCIAGNGATFFLLRHVEASRVSPLLAAKVPMLAAAAAFLPGGAGVSATQWCGVALVLASAALLAGAGRRLSAGAWAWLLLSCACYCVSDACIGVSAALCAPSFGGSLAGRSLFALCVIYAVGGVVSLAALACQGFPSRAAWRRWALPHALCWFPAMAFLFVCFASCGVVLGNIVQSVRGLLSVAIGWCLARAGRAALEGPASPAVFRRRALAAVLLVAAVALWAAGGRP